MGGLAPESPERKRALDLMGATSAYVKPNGQARYWGFNGGGAASDSAKNFLRALLRQHAGHPDAEAIRTFFNELRESGEWIDRQNVSAAIEVLKGLG
ncbi:hypothetical protein ABZY06_33880 [Streptomyces sp. NPDC006540]|uniref:hypothetical protein n=1 Tax=Streptomyces sp. NPDC006540 TaxID=3155353 RepID=UPI00339EF38C